MDIICATEANRETIQTGVRSGKLHHWRTDHKGGQWYKSVQRIKASAPAANDPPLLSNRLLEAAVCRRANLPNIEAHFPEVALERSEELFPRGIALQELYVTAADHMGARIDRSPNQLIEASNVVHRHVRISAAASTISVPTILSSVANRFIAESFFAMDTTALRVAAIRNVDDLKPTSTAAVAGDVTFEPVGPSGEVKHARLAEASYSNQAETQSRLLEITRHDFINDDLGALADGAKMLGRGAAVKLNRIFWSAFLDSAAFFVAGNSNVSTGALSEAALNAAVSVFNQQTDPTGELMEVPPAILLVPSDLGGTARRLMHAESLGPNNEGRFQVEDTGYLSDSRFTGNSSVAWYLLADPTLVPVIEIVALGGRVQPFIETALAPRNVLGVQLRGTMDVGVSKQEPRGGVRSTGQ